MSTHHLHGDGVLSPFIFCIIGDELKAFQEAE